MTQALLPCPFCGSEAFRADGGTCFVGCSAPSEECPVSPTVRTFGNADAVKYWNMRAKEQSHSQATPETGWQGIEEADEILADCQRYLTEFGAVEPSVLLNRVRQWRLNKALNPPASDLGKAKPNA